MKKIILSIIYFFACTLSLQSQTLFGTTLNGGAEDGGTIIKLIPATNDLSVARSFERIAYNPIYTNFIQATNGKLYGMTFQGGKNGVGVIFSYDPLASVYTNLHDFDNVNGQSPTGSLMQATDGKL